MDRLWWELVVAWTGAVVLVVAVFRKNVQLRDQLEARRTLEQRLSSAYRAQAETNLAYLRERKLRLERERKELSAQELGPVGYASAQGEMSRLSVNLETQIAKAEETVWKL